MRRNEGSVRLRRIKPIFRVPRAVLNVTYLERLLSEGVKKYRYIGGEAAESRTWTPRGGWFDLNLMKIDDYEKRRLTRLESHV